MAIHGNICGSQVLVHNDMLDIPNKNIFEEMDGNSRCINTNSE
jgi:hypothetical protein